MNTKFDEGINLCRMNLETALLCVSQIEELHHTSNNKGAISNALADQIYADVSLGRSKVVKACDQITDLHSEFKKIFEDNDKQNNDQI